ncbi:hypothetical protein [Dysosmobacter sp. Phy]
MSQQQENWQTGLLAGGAFAPYERFAAGKTSAQGEFTAQPLAALPPYGCGVPLAGASPEHSNHRRVEPPFGRRNPKKERHLLSDGSHRYIF